MPKLLFTALVVILLTALIGGAVACRSGQDWQMLLFYPHSMSVYFASARWIIEGGRLYREVPSEYPFLANLIFAAVRYLADLFHPSAKLFFCFWMAATGTVYLFTLYRIAGLSALATLAWLAPASIFHALCGYDIFPVFATLMALFAIQRTAYTAGALWLGVAIALKGYALFLLPTFCVFMLDQRGLLAAIKIGALAIAPMLASLLAVFIFAGWDGVIGPFAFHAVRVPDTRSTYDAINYLFGPLISGDVRAVAPWLQIGCALLAAAMRPRTFDDLVNCFLFALLGFISFSVFNSAQFFLWLLPLICFVQSRAILILMLVLCWLIYFQFPIGFHPWFAAVIVSTSFIRLLMMALIGGAFAGVRVLAISRPRILQVVRPSFAPFSNFIAGFHLAVLAITPFGAGTGHFRSRFIQSSVDFTTSANCFLTCSSPSSVSNSLMAMCQCPLIQRASLDRYSSRLWKLARPSRSQISSSAVSNRSKTNSSFLLRNASAEMIVRACARWRDKRIFCDIMQHTANGYTARSTASPYVSV